MKNKTTALILSIFVGELGIDRFYLGYIGIGLLKLFTAGCFGILWIIDIIQIATGSLQPADGSNYEDVNNNNQQSTRKFEIENKTTDVYDSLNKLLLLYQQGAITSEEYTLVSVLKYTTRLLPK